jgi:microcystin-dependent protein
MNPFIGEIRIFAGNFAPLDWAFCDGSLLPIAQYDALYSLIGTTYGGRRRDDLRPP